MFKTTFLKIIDILLIVFLIAAFAVFITGGFKFNLWGLMVRMTSFRNIIYALFLLVSVKFILDNNWIIRKDSDGLRIKIKKFFSFSK